MCLRVVNFCVPYVPSCLCPFASYVPSSFDQPYERFFFLRALRAFIFLRALLDFICLRILGLSIFTCLTCLHFLRVFIFI